MPILNQQSNAKVTAGNFMPGLFEYWEFTSPSLTTNATVTNWIGAVQSTILTNGASTLRPTNSASGVGFGGTGFQILTNLPLNIGSNFTIAVFFQYLGTDVNLQNNPMGLVGSNSVNNANFAFYNVSAGAGKYQTAYGRRNGTRLYSGPAVAEAFVTNQVLDMILCLSNNPTGGQGIFTWTNGFFVGNSSTSSTDPGDESVCAVGSLTGSADGACSFKGFIQGVYLMTNTATTVTASNIHYYRTNFLTKGASP